MHVVNMFRIEKVLFYTSVLALYGCVSQDEREIRRGEASSSSSSSSSGAQEKSIVQSGVKVRVMRGYEKVEESPQNVIEKKGKKVVQELAVVGNELITTVDIDSYMRMLTHGSKPLPKEIEKKLRNVLYERMIENCSKYMVACSMMNDRFFEILEDVVEEQYEQRARGICNSVELYNRLLKEGGISIEFVKRLIRWEIAWSAAVDTFAETSEDSLREEARRRAVVVRDVNSQKFVVSRIMLDGGSRSEGILEQIKSLVEAGYSFNLIASVYSNGSEANNGGYLGAVSEYDLSKEEFEALKQMDVEEVRSVRCAKGISVLCLHQKLASQDFSEVEYFTFTQKFQNGCDEQKLEKAQKDMRELYSSCKDADEFYQKLSSDSNIICSSRQKRVADSLHGLDKKMCSQIPETGLSEANYSSDGAVFMCVTSREHKNLIDIAASEMFDRVVAERRAKIATSLWNKHQLDVQVVRLVEHV